MIHGDPEPPSFQATFSCQISHSDQALEMSRSAAANSYKDLKNQLQEIVLNFQTMVKKDDGRTAKPKLRD